MTGRATLRNAIKQTLKLPGVGLARLTKNSARAPRFVGTYATRAEALAALPTEKRAGYDDAGIAEVSFEQMCQRQSWDYPIVFWLQQILPNIPSVVDAGGHMGTKFIAFADILDLGDTKWTVYDLPGIIAAAKAKQAKGDLPAAISFIDQTTSLPQSDLLIASGLLQYLDTSFAEFVGQLQNRPKYMLLNKVAVRDGPGLFAIERIGSGRVPYQIRNKVAWESEIAALGYRIHDNWDIPCLSHVIATHPWLGASESRGYFLVQDGESV